MLASVVQLSTPSLGATRQSYTEIRLLRVGGHMRG
jgi:hypothetical protein